MNTQEAIEVLESYRRWAYDEEVQTDTYLAVTHAIEHMKRGAPEGWKLVPKEATAENGMKMKLIGEFQFKRIRTDEDTNQDREEFFVLTWSETKDIYKAMLSAAPEPQKERK